MAITAIGSINIDESIYLEDFPEAGETIFSLNSSQSIGGKGFNQAYTLKQLEADVCFISCIGKDTNGQIIKQTFNQRELSTELLKEVDGPSGNAIILISQTSENCIVVNRGSKFELLPSDLAKHKEIIQQSQLVVAQLEIPVETVIKAFEIARSLRVTTILNPAPAETINRELLEQTDILIPNEGELNYILRYLKNNGFPDEKISNLFSLGIKILIVTLGSKGAKVYLNNGEENFFPAHQVQAFDTTAAGDSFVGAFAHFYEQTGDLNLAVEKANLMGSLTVQRKGSSNSIVSLKEFQRFEKLLNYK